MSNTFVTHSDDTDSGHKVFKLEIITDKIKYISTIDVFVEATEVDRKARELSLLVPNGQIRLYQDCRYLAVWENGERIVRRSLNSFYDNITEKEQEDSLFLCSKTHEMV